jgi:hypothetical protein
MKKRVIAHRMIKSDEVEARILAHLLRADLISECHVPPKEMRENEEPNPSWAVHNGFAL